jgi:antitoxin (DNA-binding transcriptional repressor) of toxin-antitoxin stability system
LREGGTPPYCPLQRIPLHQQQSLQVLIWDAKTYDMRTASIRDLSHGFKRIERLLRQGEEVQITRRRRIIARLIPDCVETTKQPLDFLARLRAIYGDKVLAVSGAEVVCSDRSRY